MLWNLLFTGTYYSSAIDKAIVNTLNIPENPRNLFDLASTFGADATGAIADTMAKLETEVAVTGAATSVYARRMGEFGAAVKNYQAALLTYRDATKSADVSARASTKCNGDSKKNYRS